jgi:DNA repair protein RadA/Sms
MIGEVGLAGDLRRVSGMQRRLAEAARQGFTTALIPSGSDAVPPGLRALQAPNIVVALEHMLDIAEHRSKAPTPPHRLDTVPTEQNEW